MDHLMGAVQHDLFDPGTLIGALSLGILFFAAATVLAVLVPNSVMMSSVVIRLGREPGEMPSSTG